MPDFRLFSERAIKTVMLAQKESQRLGHNYIGSEQLLVGILATRSYVREILNSVGLTVEAVRDAIEAIIGHGSGFVAIEIPWTPEAKVVIKVAFGFMQQMGHRNLEPEHLLIGILDSRETTTLRVIENLGVSIPDLRQSIWEQVKTDSLLRVAQTIASWEDPSTISNSRSYSSSAPKSLSIKVLPQENERLVAEIYASGITRGPSFSSIGYGDTEFDAIADAMERLARMYRDYRADG